SWDGVRSTPWWAGRVAPAWLQPRRGSVHRAASAVEEGVQARPTRPSPGRGGAYPPGRPFPHSQRDFIVNSTRRTATATGALFIVATIAALVAAALEPALTGADYLAGVANH